MSRRNNGGLKIPLPIIILGFLLSPPVGAVLLLFGVLSDGKDKKKGGKTSSVAAESVAENSKKGKNDRHANSKRFSAIAVLMGIMAGIFLTCSGINAIEGLTTGMFFTADSLSSTLILLAMGLASAIASGCFKHKGDCQNRIRSIIGKRDTMSLTKLSSAADLSMRKLRRELQAMIDSGEFGEEAYLDLASSLFLRYPVENTAEAEAAQENRYETAEGETPEKFRAIILQIRKLNDDIKDYAVSERIYRIEEHTQNIFDYVTEHPEAMSQIKSFMGYYLPTTLKLLDSYSRIEQVGVAGENMKKSKENIERILDLLVAGFEEQVDQLFRHESMDISSEIAVLETMMKQDGLDGRHDFSLDNTDGYTDTLSDSFSGGAASQQKPLSDT